MALFRKGDPQTARRKMRAMFGPAQVDQSIRHAIQMCWLMLPERERSIDKVEKQFRRIADRAFKDFREDAKAFKLPE